MCDNLDHVFSTCTCHGCGEHADTDDVLYDAYGKPYCQECTDGDDTIEYDNGYDDYRADDTSMDGIGDRINGKY